MTVNLGWAEYTEPWALDDQDGPFFAALMHPGAERLILFHVVASGRCFVSTADGEGVEVTLAPPSAIHFAGTTHMIPRMSLSVFHMGNNSSRADPGRGSRKHPPAPANSRNDRGRKACLRGKSPPIPAQPGSAKTGLSRRRSRVRVPSLPPFTPFRCPSCVRRAGSLKYALGLPEIGLVPDYAEALGPVQRRFG